MYERAARRRVARRLWLAKTEPDVYSIDDLARDGATSWDGVRNYAARNHLRAMRKGDGVLVYHSNADPSAVVGTAVVEREAYPDPTARGEEAGKDKEGNPRWVSVGLRFERKLARPVALAEIKATPALREMALLKLARLSVQPVRKPEWDLVLRMGKP